MVALGMLFLLLSLAATVQRKREMPCRGLLKALVWNIPLPYISIMLGWAVAEIGRQPWIVHGLMRTTDAVSPVPAECGHFAGGLHRGLLAAGRPGYLSAA